MQKTIETLQNHGVILTPTDTTFGLSCLATDPEAIQKISAIKNRPNDKNFIILVDSDARLQQMVEVPDLAWNIIDLSEKPVTIVYNKPLNVPSHLLSASGSIAIRVVNYRPLQQIIQKLKTPLISTSANLSGEKNPNSFDDINSKITQQVDYITLDCHNFTPIFNNSSLIELHHDGRIKIIRE